MDPVTHERYQRICDGFARRIKEIAPDSWTRPTPCADWDVRTLVAHVLDEQLWIPPLLDGETIEQVGDRFAGDQLGSAPHDAWASASASAAAAVAAAGAGDGIVHLSYGAESTNNYLWQVTSDTLVHTWDLARAIGADEDLGTDDVEAVAAFLGPQAEAWRAAGAFAPAVPVPADAGPLAALLGLTGRTL